MSFSFNFDPNEAEAKNRELHERHERNVRRLENQFRQTARIMDDLGHKELRAFKSFNRFSDAISKIQERPRFQSIRIQGRPFQIQQPEELKDIALGAERLLAGIGSAALGTAGAFAASGVTTAAITAFGTASTGTAISSLSGAAATNATLAILGGGTIASGGGGVALGAAILGASTLGASILIGGMIWGITNFKRLEKVNRAYDEMLKAEQEINKSCQFLKDLQVTGERFRRAFVKVQVQYDTYCDKVFRLVMIKRKRNWQEFTDEEKLIVENATLLATLLYAMCKVKLVLKTSSIYGMNRVNQTEVTRTINSSVEELRRITSKRTYTSQL